MTGRATGKNFFAEAKDILVRSVPGDVNPLPPSLESTDLVNAIETLAAMAGDIEVQYLPGVITVDTSLPGDGSGDIAGKTYHSFAAAYAFTHSHPNNYYKIELPAGELEEELLVDNNIIISGNNTLVSLIKSYCYVSDTGGGMTSTFIGKVTGVCLLGNSGSAVPGESTTIYESVTGTGYLLFENCELYEELFITDSDNNDVFLIARNCMFRWGDDHWTVYGHITGLFDHCVFSTYDFPHTYPLQQPCVLAATAGGTLRISESVFETNTTLKTSDQGGYSCQIELINCSFHGTLRTDIDTAADILRLSQCTIMQDVRRIDRGEFDGCKFYGTINFAESQGIKKITNCSGGILSGTTVGDLHIACSDFTISSLNVTGTVTIDSSVLTSYPGGGHLDVSGNIYLNNSTVDLIDIAGGAQPDEPGIIIDNSVVRARMGSAENNTSAIVSMSRSKLETTYQESETGNTEYPLPEIAAADSEIVFHIPAGTLNPGDTYTFRPTMLEHSSFTVDLVPVSGSSAMTNLLYFPEKDQAAAANLILSRYSCVQINQPYAGDPVSSHIQWYSGGTFNPQWTAKWKSDVTSYIDETVFGASHKVTPDERDRIVIRYATSAAGAGMSASSAGASYVGFMSKLGGDPSVPGNFVWVPLNSTIVDDDTASATDSITLADSTVFNRGELTSLTVTMPSGITPAFTAQINFTSGTAATQFTDSSVAAVVFTGDDTNAGLFTPVQNKRYMVLFTYDGVSSRGMVSAVDAVPQV